MQYVGYKINVENTKRQWLDAKTVAMVTIYPTLYLTTILRHSYDTLGHLL